MPLQKAPRRRQAKGNFGIICASNPSVSQSADTSPYTGEALGWCDAEGEVKLYTDNPSVTAAPCHLPLHKGGLNVQCLLFLSDVRKYKIGFLYCKFPNKSLIYHSPLLLMDYSFYRESIPRL